MKIIAIDVFSYEAPFRFAYPSAHLNRHRADSVILALQCEGHITGYGETAPRSYVTGETNESARELIRNCFAPLLIGREISKREDVEKILQDLEQICAEEGITSYRSALGAVDIALFDALGKLHGVPICNLLGPVLRKELPWSLPVPLLPEEKVRRICKGINRRTFSSLKVLVGRDEEENLKRLKMIRDLFGKEIEVRIEVNGHWTRDEAFSNLQKLTRFTIAAVEQPVARGDFEGMKAIREVFGISVIADESLCSPEDAEELLDRGACNILNIKISKVGGLLAAYRIAGIAASRGASCLLGAHVGETGILTSAALNFLIAAPTLSVVEGFSSLLFDKNSRIDDLDPTTRIGEILSAPGLGFDPEETILKNLSATKAEVE
jgi:L-alanine-DL-glutamate epimerase-like enolase superfamily enzyme